MSNWKFALKPLLIAGAAVFTVLAAPIAADYLVPDSPIVKEARAEEEGGGKRGPKFMGGRTDSGGGKPSMEGKGPPKPGDPQDPEGSDYWNTHDTWPPEAQGKSGTAGGKPAWASKELIDIGRMNVARAPDSVLARAEASGLEEFLAAIAANPAAVDFYAAALEVLQDPAIVDKQAAIESLLRDPNLVRVDSPLSNLAFYKDLMDPDGDFKVTLADGTVVFDGTDPEVRLLLASIFLASAADKTSEITPEVVHAVDVIYEFGDQLDPPLGTDPVANNSDYTTDSAIATAADAVLQAIEAVHEE